MRVWIALITFGFILNCSYPAFSQFNPIKELFEEATAAYNSGQYDRAVELYQKTIDMYPKFAHGYEYLGLARKARGDDLNDVLWYFKKAIEYDPNFAEAYDNLGKTYYSLGQFDKAQENSLKAVELNPDLITAHLTVAWIYLIGKGDGAKAIPYFEKGLSTGEDLPFVQYGLGMAYIVDGQKFKALDMITKLRHMGEEDLAGKLEAMTRTNEPLPEGGLQAVFKEERKRSKLIEDVRPVSEADGGGMKVRLRDVETSEPVPSAPDGLSPAERIREMQKKARARGEPGY